MRELVAMTRGDAEDGAEGAGSGEAAWADLAIFALKSRSTVDSLGGYRLRTKPTPTLS